MLTIRCATCKTKLWKYDKIVCPNCKRPIGIDKGTFYKMDPNAFLYNGTKRNK